MTPVISGPGESGSRRDGGCVGAHTGERSRWPGMRTPSAVILCGGRGTRLGPFTTILPKPLLPIGDHAILEVVVHQLSAAGFGDLVFAIGYLGHLIEAVFGEGARHGAAIRYHREDEPLGTAGALGSISGLDDTFLMMNGDVLTDLDYRDLYDAHRAAGNLLTIATHRRVVKSDYGILHLSEARGGTTQVVGYEEKPEVAHIVSMGIYVLEESVTGMIGVGEHLDLPDLVLRLLERGAPVGSYLYDGIWLDIGRHEDYEMAISEFGDLSRLRPTRDSGSPSAPR
jgi:NDP-mannose synthase